MKNNVCVRERERKKYKVKILNGNEEVTIHHAKRFYLFFCSKCNMMAMIPNAIAYIHTLQIQRMSVNVHEREKKQPASSVHCKNLNTMAMQSKGFGMIEGNYSD